MTDSSSGEGPAPEVDAGPRPAGAGRPAVAADEVLSTSRVLVFVERDEDRRLLVEWLAPDHEVVTASTPTDLDAPFDLAVLDRGALARHREALAERKHREDPVVVPYLLVLPRRELDRLEPAGRDRLREAVRDHVDELITAPIAQAELAGRIDSLLDARARSVRLRDERERYRRLLSVTPEAIVTVGVDGTIGYSNDQGADLLGAADPGSARGGSLFETVHDADRDAVRGLIRAAVETGERQGFVEARLLRGGERRHVELGGVAVPGDGRPSVLLVVRDVTDRRRRERTLERQRDALRRLDRLNALIRDIDEGLVSAATREEIERTVCDRLVGGDRYVAAWVGTDGAVRRRVSVREHAGDAASYLDGVTVSTATGEGERDPVGEALATREVVVADVSSAGGGWRAVAADCGFEAAIAVPLVYEGAVYGALGIFADRPGAFDDPDEVTVLRELGGTIGHAIAAAESRRALLAERVVELEFALDAPDSVLHRVSTDLDCPFRLEGVVAATNGSYLEYFAVEGCDHEAVLDRMRADPAVEHARFVGEHGGEALFEFAFAEEQVVQAFGRLGGRVVDLHVRNGQYEATVEFPHGSDTHAIVAGLHERYAAASLLAQRETERAPTSPQAVWASFRERLTDRQWEVLQTAYYAGFFEWPRSSTGEEVAASIGVSAATFHEHLRAAERKLLEALLEE